MHADRGYWAVELRRPRSSSQGQPSATPRWTANAATTSQGYCVLGSATRPAVRRLAIRRSRPSICNVCGRAQRDARQIESDHNHHLYHQPRSPDGELHDPGRPGTKRPYPSIPQSRREHHPGDVRADLHAVRGALSVCARIFPFRIPRYPGIHADRDLDRTADRDFPAGRAAHHRAGQPNRIRQSEQALATPGQRAHGDDDDVGCHPVDGLLPRSHHQYADRSLTRRSAAFCDRAGDLGHLRRRAPPAIRSPFAT